MDNEYPSLEVLSETEVLAKAGAKLLDVFADVAIYCLRLRKPITFHDGWGAQLTIDPKPLLRAIGDAPYCLSSIAHRKRSD